MLRMRVQLEQRLLGKHAMSIKAGMYDVVLAVGVLEKWEKAFFGGAGGGDGIPKEGLLGSGTNAMCFQKLVWNT